MRLIDLAQNSQWAIMPEMLDQIHQVLYSRQHDIKVDIEALERSMGRKLDNSYDVTVTEEGLAIIPISGVLAKRMNLFMQISGGTSTELVRNDFILAMEDPDIKAILLDEDTPGGTVDGTGALAETVFEYRGKKPVVAFANGLMASAGYWIGSAADYIVAEPTAELGSIGVVMAHYDYSKYDEKMGVKRTFIYSGKYKTVGNNAEPLTREAEDILKARTDYLYSIFVDQVARNRGVTSQDVLDNMADGRIFIGQQTVDAGLADEVGNMEQAAEKALSMVERDKGRVYYNLGATAPETKEDNTMFLKKKATGEAPDVLTTIKAEHPDIVEQLTAEGRDQVDTDAYEKRGAQAEQDRICSLAVAYMGEEEGGKFTAMVKAGLTGDQCKSMGHKLGTPGKEKMAEMLEEIKEAGASNPGSGGDQETAGAGKDFMAQVEAYMSVHKCKKSEAIKAVMLQDPKGHESWVISQQQGSVH